MGPDQADAGAGASAGVGIKSLFSLEDSSVFG